MSMIESAPVSTFRSPTVVSGILPVKLGLSSSVTYVQSGTPLRSSPTGWVTAPNGLGEFVAATGSHGGEIIDGFRLAVINFHREPLYRLPWFEMGKRYSVQDVDDKGVPEFVRDDVGVYLAVSQREMLMDMTVASLHLRAVESTRASADVADRGGESPRVSETGDATSPEVHPDLEEA